jgi:hypothetical protein
MTGGASRDGAGWMSWVLGCGALALASSERFERPQPAEAKLATSSATTLQRHLRLTIEKLLPNSNGRAALRQSVC